MRVMAQLAMVMNLEKVHRLPYLLGDVQAGVDQSQWDGVRLVQQRRDPSWSGLSTALSGPGDVAGRLGTHPAWAAQAQSGRTLSEAVHHLRESAVAQYPRLLRAVDLRLREPHRRAAR